MFPGRNNNDMLRRFMDSIGPFSAKTVRRHVASFTRLGLPPHFEHSGSQFNFRRQENDKVTGRSVIRVVAANSGTMANKQILQVLLRSRSASDGRGDVLRFSEFLSRCLTLDPTKRIGVDEALIHDFFTASEQQRKATSKEVGTNGVA